MFFIVNHENGIIAADTDFLEGIGAEDIYQAASLIKNGEIQLDELEQSMTYLQTSSSFSKTKLSTFLGEAYLYQIVENVSTGDTETSVEQTGEEDLHIPIAAVVAKEISEASKNETNDTLDAPLDQEKEELFDLTESKTEEEELFNLAIDHTAPETSTEEMLFEIKDEVPVPEEKEKEEESTGLNEVISLAGAGTVGATIHALMDSEEDDAPKEGVLKESIPEEIFQISDDPVIFTDDTPVEINEKELMPELLSDDIEARKLKNYHRCRDF